jgi:hypothetical protein
VVSSYIFRQVGKVAKSDYYLRQICLSVRLSAWRNTDRFHYNLTRITGTLHEDKYTFFLSYLAQFFFVREMFRTKVVELIKTHILRSVAFF